MSLSIGIVGLPNAGKSTLFNALTGAGALAASYPFATIDPNVGVVPIPDPRVELLASLIGSAKATPATVRFVDIAGLVPGASEGEGLGNQFLANIRDTDAICHVVRAFDSEHVAHIEADVDAARDIGYIDTELALADLEVLERRVERVGRQATADRSLQGKLAGLQRLATAIGAGEAVRSDPGLKRIHDEIGELGLLTAKPVVYVFNCDQSSLEDLAIRAGLEAQVAPAASVMIDAQLESELAELSPSDREELFDDPEPYRSGLDRVVHAAFRALGLQTFLTTNPNETRAWTIEAGSTAFEAAGEIHTDFQRGFIAAEVIDFDQLVEAGSWQRARAAGVVRTEGKGYEMRPSDVVEFRFNT